MNRALRDRYGFLFWLKWIVWFAACFVFTAVFWTSLMRKLFDGIHGPELIFTWVVCVFGSWLVLVIPFMRKKEQIWKRLNDDQEKAVDVWLTGMCVFIGLLIVSLFFWSVYLKDRLHTEGTMALDGVWVKAVLSSWLVIVLPFLVFLYRRADEIFKEAMAHQTYRPLFKNFSVEKSKRLLPPRLVEKLKSFEQTLPGGHVVSAELKTGEKISDIFILNGNEILGFYDADGRMDEQFILNFDVRDIMDVFETSSKDLPAYEESKWIRLDGKT